MEVPYRRDPRTEDMHVCWSVIIRIDDYPEPINPVDRRHTILYTKPKRLGIMIYTARHGPLACVCRTRYFMASCFFSNFLTSCR